jgi:hypothetical protein
MAETLGSLCDKLTIVKLKQFHADDTERLTSLAEQLENLVNEIDDFISKAIVGQIPANKLTFKANKIFKSEGNETRNFKGTIGDVFAKLADINCLLWHEQEKVFEFEIVPTTEKNTVVKKLAILNLERNKCIDEIDNSFKSFIENK